MMLHGDAFEDIVGECWMKTLYQEFTKLYNDIQA